MPRTKKLKRNISIFMFGKFLEGFGGLWSPIFIFFFTTHIGFTFTEVLTIEGIYALTILIFEIPSGIISDRIGCKKTIILGNLLIGIACFGIAFSRSFVGIMTYQIIWGIGESFLSGSEDALFYNSIKELNKQKKNKEELVKKEYQKLRAKMNTNASGISSIMNILGAVLATYIGFTLPIILVGLSCLALSTIYLFLIEADHEENKEKQNIIEHSRDAIKTLSTPFLISVLVIASLFELSNMLGFVTMNPYWEQMNIPILWFGFIFAFYNAVATFASSKTDYMIKKLGNKKTQWFILGIYIITFLLMSIPMGAWWAILIPSFIRINRSAIFVFIDGIIHEKTKNHNRATVLSIKSFATKIIQTIYLPFFGYLTDNLSLFIALQVTVIIISIIAVPITLWMWKKKEKYSSLPITTKEPSS